MQKGNKHEYIGVYVDDLAIIVHDTKEIKDILVNKYTFKLKGTGHISYHLGMDVYCSNTGTLCILPLKYIDKMIASYEHFFGSKPSQKYLTPLEKGDHPEFDTSDYLDDTVTQCHQSLIGAMQ
jgi:Reverse transcriptase (RNA-dependent DNA polymerase)